jgi:ABC-type transport system involved in Fe-S cluster assembly fused permease/ATPase subunit
MLSLRLSDGGKRQLSTSTDRINRFRFTIGLLAVVGVVALAVSIGWWSLLVIWIAVILYVAIRMNISDERRRSAAQKATYSLDPSGKPAVQVIEYKSIAQFEADAMRRLTVGWRIQSQSSEQGRISLPGTVAKGVIYHPWALISPSRKNGKIVVTWTRNAM